MDNQDIKAVFRLKKYLMEAIKFHKIEEVRFTQTGAPFEVNSESNELISSGKGTLTIEFDGYESWFDFEESLEDEKPTSKEEEFVELLKKCLPKVFIELTRSGKINLKIRP